MYFRINIDTSWLDAIRIRYTFLNLTTCEMVAIVIFIWQSVLPAYMEIIVLRIAVWRVEILGYVTKKRVTVTEAVWQGGKEICVRMVNMCLKRCVSYNKCIMYNVYIYMICSANRIVCIYLITVPNWNNWTFHYT